jgi:hypothetical protein
MRPVTNGKKTIEYFNEDDKTEITGMVKIQALTNHRHCEITKLVPTSLDPIPASRERRK